MRAPLITLTCDCGATAEVAYGDRWSCPTCQKSWDTTQIPAADYDVLVRGVNRYRYLVLGPPILFALVMAWALLAVPQLRRRTADQMRRSTKKWKLRPE